MQAFLKRSFLVAVSLGALMAVAIIIIYQLPMKVPLPEGYTLVGKGRGHTSDRSHILSPSGERIQDDVLDIVVQGNYVYGCYGTPANHWFILNTADGNLQTGLTSQAYGSELRRLGLPIVYIGDPGINILEIRTGHKKVYWMAHP